MNIGTIAGLVNVRANIDTVICEVPKIETTKGGIVLPESAIHTAKPTTAKALLVGPFSNNRAAFKVEAGDTVHFQQHAGFEVEIGDSKYLVLAASQIILAVGGPRCAFAYEVSGESVACELPADHGGDFHRCGGVTIAK